MSHRTRVMIGGLSAALMLATTAAAQSVPGYVIPSVPAPRDPLPRFTIAQRGMPLGAVGLPLPQIGLQPPPVPGNEVHHRWQRPVFAWPMMVFYVPTPVIIEPAPAPKPVDPPAPKAVETPMPGRLILDVHPASAQVFADGYYVGVSGDFSLERGGGVLDAGTHRLDVSAPGYEPVAVDLRVSSGQSVTYRATLKALPAPATVKPSTFYLIPGCYMGNIAPEAAHLPESCAKKHAITWVP